jgi:hypothetical protein
MKDPQAADDRIEAVCFEWQPLGIPGVEHALLASLAGDRRDAAALSLPGPQATSSSRVPCVAPTASRIGSLTCEVTRSVARS